ncbi:MAG: TolC family protein [Ignavibacteriaceae bacterium]
MKFYFNLLLALISFSVTGLASAQSNSTDSLTVEDAIHIVLSSNPSIQQQMHLITASKARVEESKSSLYPNAGISLNYARLGPLASINFPGLGNFNMFPANNFDEHIGVSATIFDFDKRKKDIDFANSQVAGYKDKLELVKQELAYRTAQIFYTILFLKQSIKVQNDAINTLKEHILLTKKKVAAGTATEFDVLTTNVHLSTAEEEKINLENSLSNSVISLRQLLGLPANENVEPVGEFTESPVQYNVDSLINLAMQNRYEIKSANDQIASEKAHDNIVSAMYNPTVNIAASYGVKNGYIPNLEAWRGNYMAAVNVDIPLSGVIPYFGGYREEKMHQESSANIQAADSYKSDVILQVKTDVQKGVSDLHSSLAKFNTTDAAVQQADTALSQAKIRYEAGTVTNLDLLDAETSLAQAKLMRLEALYKYVLGRYELLQAIGEKAW